LCVYQLFYSLSQEANVILKMCPNWRLSGHSLW
jgi:hypothetical protein